MFPICMYLYSRLCVRHHCCECMLSDLQKGTRKQFLCKCSFLEIYQEQVFDLLDPTSSNLQLRESMKKGVFVDGLMEHVVTSPSEAYQVGVTVDDGDDDVFDFAALCDLKNS